MRDFDRTSPGMLAGLRAARVHLSTWPLVFVVLLWGSALANAQEYGEIGIARGEKPELVELEDLEGNPVSLAQYVGEKPVLLEFWATWCENCRELLPQMIDTYARYGDRIEYVAIAVAVAQSRRSVKRRLEQEPVDYPTLWDTKGRAVRAFLAPSTSYIVILDASGTVVYTGIGPMQDIEAAVTLALE